MANASKSTNLDELTAAVRGGRLPPPRERRRIRTRARASLRATADAIPCAPMTLLRWERGDVEPTLDNAARYRAVLDALREAVEGVA